MPAAAALGPAVLVLGCVVLSAAALACTTAGPPLTDRPPGAAQGPTFAAPSSAGRVEVWVDLEMPPLAAMPTLTAAERAAYLLEIDAQQSLLIERLRQLGAEERARVQLVRNALVVDVPESALGEIRRLPGVARVQLVTHRNRIHTPATTNHR